MQIENEIKARYAKVRNLPDGSAIIVKNGVQINVPEFDKISAIQVAHLHLKNVAEEEKAILAEAAAKYSAIMRIIEAAEELA